VRARLDNDREVQALEDPEAEPTSIFRFHGRAARAIQSETYYVAVLTPGTAVLLTGWVGHVVGQAPTEKVQLSPSAHPLAAASSFAGGDGGDGAGKALSYAWQAVYRSAGGPGVTLPVVGGLAVFAGAYPASAGRSTASGCCA
jgi:hypothetical protein